MPQKTSRFLGPCLRLKAHLPQISICLLSFLGISAGCAQPALEPGETPNPVPFVETSETFEQLKLIQAKNQFSPDLVKTQHYRILDDVIPEDMTYVYTIESSFGQFEARNEWMLRNRIREIQALIELENISSPEAFGTGVAKTIVSPLIFLWDLVTDPKETVQSIPEGISRSMNRMGEMFRGERGKLEESETKELLGFNLAKREIANHLGIDVYSSNPILQKNLTSVAWAAYAGGMSSRLLTIPVTGPIGVALMGTSFSATMNNLVLDSTPEDLRGLNRHHLLQMGVKENLIEQFLNHPWYSPRHETILVHALVEMTEVRRRGRFIEIAVHAQSEEDALFFQQLAEMMASYHHSVINIDELVLLAPNVIVGYTLDQAFVAMLPFPRLLWTPLVAEASEAILSAWETMPHKVHRAELWLTGHITKRAQQELEMRGFMIHDRTLERLMTVQSTDQDTTIGLLFPKQ